MTGRVWAHLGIAVVAAVAVDATLLLRGGDLVLATLVVFAAVGTLGVAFEATTRSTTAWVRQPRSAEDRPPSDAGLAGLRRLITDNQTARAPDRALQERLLRLADARGGARAAEREVLERLRRESRPVRFGPRTLARVVDEIEEL